MKKQGLFFHLITFNLFAIILPITMIFSVFSIYLIEHIQQNDRRVNENEYQTIIIATADLMNTLNTSSLSIIGSRDIQTFLSMSRESPHYFESYRAANTTLTLVKNQCPYISAVYLESKTHTALGTAGYLDVSCFTPDELVKMEGSTGEWFWDESDGHFALYRLIRSIDDVSKHLGYMKFILNREAIAGELRLHGGQNLASVGWVSSDRLLLTRDLPISGTLAGLMDSFPAKDLNHAFTLCEKDSDYHFYNVFLPRYKLNIACVFKNNAPQYNSMMTRILTLFLLFFFLVECVQLFSFKRRFINPIRTLSELMNSIEKEHYGVQFEETTSLEIQTLADQFNRMSNQLAILYNDIYQSKLLYLEAKFQALQAEINPHFLYNTLDSTSWMIQLGQPQEAMEMLHKTSQLFRYSLEPIRDGMVSLHEEIDHAVCYISIQQLRFKDKLVFELEADESLRETPVIKFALQPLLENAVTHGISTGSGIGEISLMIYSEEGDLIYHIWDNGTRADEERIRRLLAFGPEEKRDSRGLALRNINARLKLKFGSRYGIYFEKLEDGTSAFMVRQPMKGDRLPNEADDH